ncbi:AraC family transcriptional regulator [Chitinophaga vietnamensis]|uniref:AraC family transcriptional regulator n=1 Tax=Chitinophaga vietnamensis TaxID=2593957 RepID=UPI001177F320|nr:AraC family transcriptional regulator [Chitinophaga vietnamensis]
MDPLSNVLSLLKPSTFVSAGLNAGGKWAIQFPRHEGIKFNAVLKGTCILQVEGERKQYRLHPGDCFLLTSGRPFVLGNDLSIKKIKSNTIYDKVKDGIATCNGGGEFFLIGARFHFEEDQTKFLFGSLPPVVYVPEKLDHAAVLRWGLDRFTTEFRADQLGRTTILEHLAPIMLVQTLRIYLSSPDARPAGWLFALSNPQLAKAVQALHAHPEKKWTVEKLGKIAGMSRSGFALKFKQLTGYSPLDYLTHWRMVIACEMLKTGDHSMYDIATAAGYDAESSFSAAFKRTIGKPPKIFQKEARANQPVI